ncbi:hypothetical protein [Mucilaginibacter glaciei]|uniref:Uncharacterized protein n=1 Tax=Mucilaginibacter glaciei TaxID=2772109 RepID=A0A926S3Y9_9SPHI|nr:hypothetical protein [Mucilaginibacter glaciei]MBD1395427.1 hypothetical protein [Mucilaginibacter glaciei]
MKRVTKIGAGLILTAMITASAMVWAVVRRQMPAAREVAKIGPVAVRQYDKTILEELNRFTRRLSLAGNCTFSGVLSITNNEDSAKRVVPITFLCSKNAERCYIRYGGDETLNDEGLCIFIQHDQKKVVITAQKQVVTAVMPDLGTLTSNLSGDNYALTRSRDGADELITLKNDRHISCKEYRIRADSASQNIKEVYVRLSNVSDPLNKAKDKVIDMVFSNWSEQADPGKYLKVGDVLKRRGTAMSLNDAYRNYELIRL